MSEMRRRDWRRIAGVVVVVAVLVSLSVFQIAKLAGGTKIFESTAILQLEPPVFLGELSEGDLSDYWTNEGLAMTSDEVLRPVVDELELARRWSLSAESAVLSLRGFTQVERLASREGRSRYSISVRNEEAELAREMAAGIAREYRSQGNDRVLAAAERELERLDAEIKAQKRLVEEKRAKLQAL